MKRAKYPKKADILIVFDHPTKDEVKRDEPFTAISTMNMLTSLRTGRASVFNKAPVLGWNGIFAKDSEMTYLDYSYFGDIEGNYDYALEISRKPVDNFVKYRNLWISPRLASEIESFLAYVENVNPKVIVITGKWALFVISEEVKLGDTISKITEKPLGALQRYRGSILIKDNRIYYPIYHTLFAVTMPEQIPIIDMDLQKLGDIANTVMEKGIDSYRINHIYHLGDDAIGYLKGLLEKLNNNEPLVLSVDLETMFYKVPGQSIIDCIGIAHSPNEGACIALAMPGIPSLHSLAREQEILGIVFELLTHPNASIIGQNIVAFDTMVLLGRYLFLPNVTGDTLILQHLLYSFLPKDLAFLASMYCKSSSYWKGEIAGDTRWIYNIKDTIYTYEVFQAQMEYMRAEDPKVQELYRHTMQELVPATIKTMRRGVKVDIKRKEELYKTFIELGEQVKTTLYDCLGFEFNLNSPKQKKKILEEFFNVKLKLKRKRGKAASVTMDANAMMEYIDDYPLIKPFLATLLEYTAISKFAKTFLGAALDPDGRMRTQYKVAGTVTGRLASSKNAFGRAANLQNIPKKGKLELVYATDLSEDLDSQYLAYSPEGSIQLPNIKKMFIPDEGMELMDADLCLTEDHEILTLDGWVNIRQFTEEKDTTPIACWGPDTGIYWDTVERHIVKLHNGPIYEYNGKVSVKGTGKHKQPMFSVANKFRAISFAELFDSKAQLRYLHSDTVKGSDIRVNPNYLKLLVATQADGCFPNEHSASLRFSFKKQRKVDRLLKILIEEKCEHRIREEPNTGYTHIYLTSDNPTAINLRDDLGKEKIFPNWLLMLQADQIGEFVNELQYWDGSKQKLDNFSYSTAVKENADMVQALCALCCKYAAFSIEVKDRYVPLYVLYISNKTQSQDRATVRTQENFTGLVYCVTTKTGYFVCRRNNKVCITGNSGADAMVVAWDSNCKFLIDFFTHREGKLYAFIASEHLQREITSSSPEYKVYKAICHGSNYGMGLDKLALTLGIDLTSAKRLQNWYFTMCPEIPLWHKRIQERIEKYGFITNVFGRKAYFIDKTDVTRYNRAYGFIGQSTVADAMNIAWPRVEKIPDIEVLKQVHDSLVTQYPIPVAEACRKQIISAMTVEIPYNSKLVIPVDYKTSTISYGDI